MNTTTASKAKSVASQLKGQLTSAKKTAVRRSAAKKLSIEFRDRKTDIIYSYLLFQKGNTYMNLSVTIDNLVEKPYNKPASEVVEEILDRLDKPTEFELVDYGGKFDVETTDKFDEKGLKFFVKEVKKNILNKLREDAENETKKATQ